MLGNRRGSNAVEFALVSVVLFPILLGCMDYGWLFFNQIALDEACRLGAREAARVPASLAFSGEVEQEDEEGLDDPVVFAAASAAGEATASGYLNSVGVKQQFELESTASQSNGQALFVLSCAVSSYSSFTGGIVPVPEQLLARSAALVLN